MLMVREGRGDETRESAHTPLAESVQGTRAADICLQDADCAQLANRARLMSEAHQYESALLAYQAAYAMRPAPWLQINIGRVNQKLGRFPEAIANYRKFLSSDELPKTPETESRARMFLAQAEMELAKQLPKPANTASTEEEPAPAPLSPPSAIPTTLQAPSVPNTATSSVSPQPAARERKPSVPVYTRPWFIGTVSAGIALIAVGIGVGVGVSRRFVPPATILYPELTP